MNILTMSVALKVQSVQLGRISGLQFCHKGRLVMPPGACLFR